jgi:hypothetical protein
LKRLTKAQAIVDAPYVEDALMDGQSAEYGAAVVKVKPIMVNKAHIMCGHMGHVEAREICDYYGQLLTTRGF